MKNWQKALIITLITLAIGGIYLLVVFEHRRNPGVAQQTNPEQNLTPDDVAVVRMMFPTSFDDVLKLENTSVWMKNGYTMPYFPTKPAASSSPKPLGVIPSAQQLDIKKVIKAVPPAQVDDGISHGTRQVFAIFALPGSASLYATAIGVIDGSQEAVLLRRPFLLRRSAHHLRQLAQKCVGRHRRAPGASRHERTCRPACPSARKPNPIAPSEGNRTVTYDQAGKNWTVTFVDNQATTIKTNPVNTAVLTSRLAGTCMTSPHSPSG